MGRAFSTSYLAGEASARDVLPGDIRDPLSRGARARAAAARPIDPALAALLRQQDQQLPPSAARRANLDALAAGGAAAVVTGQQVGLFLGPLYSFYKAATAVAAARAIQAESGVCCVPLFWLQTEDHDFAEIASCTVAGPNGEPARLALADEAAAEARTSIAGRCLGAEVTGLLDALREALPGGPATDQTVALLRAWYRPGARVAGAFAATLAQLFAEEGLLVLDPRQAAFAALAAPMYRKAIEAADAIDDQLAARGAWLAARGFDQQVAVRRGSPLVFFHPDGPDGPRFRLARAEGEGGGDAWSLAGRGGADAQILRREDLLRALARDPLCFSTSALLRPVVQDALLPVVGTVAGPGEMNYFAQLPPLYDLFGVAPSLVLPRARFRCVDARTRRLLAETGLCADDAGKPPGELPAPPAAAGGVDPAELRRRVAAEIAPAVDRIAREVAPLGPPLGRAAERTRRSVAHALERLIGRAAAALAERDQVRAGRIDRLRRALYPDGIPQERFYGWPSLAGRHGPAELKRLVLERLEASGPFATGLLDLSP